MELDVIAGICLRFGHITFILPFVLLGMIFHDRNLYAKATCFLFLVMIFNTLLKYWFKVPLFPHLGPGYAFPSGHMHAASVFFGYIVYKINSKIMKIALIFVICSLGFSLIHCRFHNMFDVLGALAFAVAEIFIYHLIRRNFGEKCAAVVALAAALLSMACLQQIHRLEFHVVMAFYGLVGTIFSISFIEESKLRNYSQKFLALGMSVLLITAVYFVFKMVAFKQLFLSETKFALLPLIIMMSINLSSRLRLESAK
jgi:undecaprenyl-diphosphatase